MDDHDGMDDNDCPPPLGFLPESLEAWKNGWSEMDESNEAFSVINEEELFSKQMGDSLKDTFVFAAKSLWIKL
jgi:hypothetical protein